MARKPLSNVDAAWLRMDDPTNLMMITGFFEFSGPVDFERLRATIDIRLVKRWERFHQWVRESRLPLRGPYWEDDPHFDLDNHIFRIGLPSPGDEATLKEMISKLSSRPLDKSKPLWEFHLIENLQGGGSFLVARLHHAIADGIALMSVLMTLCDVDADAPWPEPEPEEAHQRRGRQVRSLFPPAAAFFAAGRAVADEGKLMLLKPGHAMKRAEQAAAFMARLGRLTLLPPDTRTIFKGDLGRKKVVAWTQDMPLEDVKRVKSTFRVTVNDVVVAAVAGGLRRYLIHRGERVSKSLSIRAMVPVNLRPLDQAAKLGNHFGLVVLALPVGMANPLERMMEVKRRMDDLKGSPEAVVGFTLLELMGMSPAQIEKIALRFFAMKSTLVLTNVPGPRQKLYFAGSPIERIMFWVPQAGRLGMGVSIFSYAGAVNVGVMTDYGLAPDPEQIARFIEEEFSDMLALTNEIRKESTKPVAP
ncbi:MAG TPA: wax ester/triacylglycerol synthase family O-acyltransferase [Caldilineales bacterium]|nr:wax ester/triacylglycerol synthase family O-acyltransferase [Caldilineales bacterium]